MSAMDNKDTVSPATPQDPRSVPVEVLRDFARSRAEISSIRAVADEVGISHSALHKFTNGVTQPQPRVRRLLALWYLKKQGEAPDVDVIRPYLAALNLLTAEVPGNRGTVARAAMVEELGTYFTDGKPRWLELLARLRAG